MLDCVKWAVGWHRSRTYYTRIHKIHRVFGRPRPDSRRAPRDRRVRWIALPVQPGPDGIASPGWIEPLLSKASCPVLLVPNDVARHEE